MSESVVDKEAMIAQIKDTVFGVKAPEQNNPAPAATNDGGAGVINQPVATPAAPAASTTDDETIDIPIFLKENFGMEDLDSIKKEWQTYQGYKANPPKAEFQFKDETSKKWATYFGEGKEDELRESLNARHTLKDVEAMNDEQRLKLFIKLNNPLFDQELIDYNYQQTYGFNDKPFKDEDGNVTDQLGMRFAKTQAAQRMQSDIAKANEYFAQYKSKVDLSDILPQQPVDEDFVSYKKFTEEANQKYDQLTQALSKVPTDAPSRKFSFNDEASKIKFDIDYQMDKEGYRKAVETAAQYLIVSDRYYGQDGSLAMNDLIWDIYQSQNRDKMVGDLISNAVSNAINSFVAQQKNLGGIQRTLGQPVNQEIEQYKQQVFGKTA